MRSRRRNAPSVPAALQRSASASNRRFSLPENRRRVAIATTSGSRRDASCETVSPVALRAPSATASQEELNDPFAEDFSNEVMCMSYLYSNCPRSGVPHHIGTGGYGERHVSSPESRLHHPCLTPRAARRRAALAPTDRDTRAYSEIPGLPDSAGS